MSPRATAHRTAQPPGLRGGGKHPRARSIAVGQPGIRPPPLCPSPTAPSSPVAPEAPGSRLDTRSHRPAAALPGPAPCGRAVLPTRPGRVAGLSTTQGCHPVPCRVPTLARHRLRGEASSGGGAVERQTGRKTDGDRAGRETASLSHPRVPCPWGSPGLSHLPRASAGAAPRPVTRFPHRSLLPALSA